MIKRLMITLCLASTSFACGAPVACDQEIMGACLMNAHMTNLEATKVGLSELDRSIEDLDLAEAMKKWGIVITYRTHEEWGTQDRLGWNNNGWIEIREPKNCRMAAWVATHEVMHSVATHYLKETVHNNKNHTIPGFFIKGIKDGSLEYHILQHSVDWCDTNNPQANDQ